MHNAIPLTLLVLTQAPANPAAALDPPPIPRQAVPRQIQVEVARPTFRTANVRAVTVLHTRLGSRQVRLEERPEPPVVDGEVVAPPPPQPVGVIILRTLAVSRENFDEWVFTVKRDDRDRMAHLRMRLQGRIDEVELRHPLDPTGRRKLELAGGGDIRRFLDRVEAQRADFEWARQDFELGTLALDATLPLAEEFRDGPFGAGSLFAKTLARIEAGEIAPGRPVPTGRDATARP